MSILFHTLRQLPSPKNYFLKNCFSISSGRICIISGIYIANIIQNTGEITLKKVSLVLSKVLNESKVSVFAI